MLQVRGYLHRAWRWRPLIFCGVALGLMTVASQVAAVDAPKSIAVMDCTLIDDNAAYNDADTNRIQHARIGMISDDLRTQLRERKLYRVADNTPVSSMISQLSSTQDMNSCNGCELQVARKLGVERVGVCWVQKVSNLIININLRVEDVASGKAVFQRSVDIRGNTDLSWRRGVKALVDRLAEDPDATR